MDKSNLYDVEETVLREAKSIIKSEEWIDHPLHQNFITLTDNFDKILREMKKIIKISDGQQEYLQRIQTELKNEIEYRIRAEEKLKYIAAIDSLTGVYNRGTGLSMLENQIISLKRGGNFCTLCYLDVNGLKFINDNYGHIEGDDMLVMICNCLKKQIRENDILCRIGGDEFFILFPQLSITDAKNTIEQALENLRMVSKEKPFSLSFSYGLVYIDEKNASTIDELIEMADRYMYEHKKEYRKPYEPSSPKS